MKTHFHGVWRMDWGLGNPNKTAALIAILIVSIWIVSYMRKGAFWSALAPFTVLGICLCHTMSRGGLVSAIAGLIPLLMMAPRPWPLANLLSVLICIWTIIVASVYLETYGRYGQGFESADPSIVNRLALWRVGPRMMVDAPSGWGLGQSGQSYVQWYQPLNHHEEYRTLVNSHLTSLVEANWLLRFLYVVGWVAIFTLCWPPSSRSWYVVALGVWLAFFVAAFFSSVAESPWLWIVPLGFLIWMLADRILRHEWPSRRVWLLPVSGAVAILAGLMVVGYSEPNFHVQGYPDHVVYGGQTPTTWILLNEKVMGQDYGRVCRMEKGAESVGLTHSASFVAKTRGNTLLLAGTLSPEELGQLALDKIRFQNIVLLDPSFYPQEVKGLDLARVSAYFGEFSQSPSIDAWKRALGPRRARSVAGTGDFLGDWPSLLAEKSKPAL